MITGFLTEGDYLAAQRLHSKRRPGLFVFVLVYAVMCVAGAWMIVLGEGSSGGYILLGAGIIGCVLRWGISVFWLPRHVHKCYAQQRALHAQFTYSWDETGIRAESENGQCRRLWGDYIKIKQDEKIVLLYITNNLFEVLPKSWLKDKAQLDDFLLHLGRAGVKGA